MSEPVSFPPFRLDPASGQLWRDGRPVALRQKNFALLCYLAARPGRLVSKQELLDALWPGTYVTDVVLKVCINELRQALDDDSKRPRFIETVHRRGYRFVAGVSAPQRAGGSGTAASAAAVTSAPATLVGRDAALAELERALGEACGGGRRMVLVSGEAGLGKTTLLEAFLARIAERAPDDGAWIVRGQCVASYGAREPFLPVLDGLGRLCRESDESRLVERLRALAPEWLVQLGGVLPDDEREALRRRAGNTAPERMLRTLGDALDALSRERPVLLALEDLHWSDHSTIDLLSYVAQRGETARLLIVGTYRPVEAIVHGQPVRALKQELVLRRRCRELALDLLDEPAVRAYLAARFPELAAPGELARWLHAKTDGNPLFLVTVVDELVARGLLVERGGAAPAGSFERVGVPESLRQMIEQQLERLRDDDRLLLEAASVAGMRFAATTLATAAGADLLEVEERCAGLAREGRFLRALDVEESPDGAATAYFAFTHSLYREHLYSRIGPSRRALLHRRVGEHLERASGSGASEHAAQLALHFEECREHGRALLYLRGVAERALRAGAHREVLSAVGRGLALVERLTDDAERTTTALALNLTRGQALLAAKGFADPEVKEAFDRVRALTGRTEETPQLAAALAGLWAYHNLRGNTAEMRALTERLAEIAERAPFPGASGMAFTFAGMTSYQKGEPARARAELERALAASEERNPFGFVDLGAPCTSVLALALLMLGHPDQALARHEAALARARRLGGAFDLALALTNAVELLHALDDAPAALRLADEGIALATEHAFPLWLTVLGAVRGWAVAETSDVEAGIAQMERSLRDFEALGGQSARPLFLAMLAAARVRAGRGDGAQELFALALQLVEQTGDSRHLPEIHRVAGACQAGVSAARAEASYRVAIEVAQAQGARWWELRATTSLASLLARARGRSREALALLEPLCASFDEGADTADVRRARTLVAELRRTRRRP